MLEVQGSKGGPVPTQGTQWMAPWRKSRRRRITASQRLIKSLQGCSYLLLIQKGHGWQTSGMRGLACLALLICSWAGDQKGFRVGTWLFHWLHSDLKVLVQWTPCLFFFFFYYSSPQFTSTKAQDFNSEMPYNWHFCILQWFFFSDRDRIMGIFIDNSRSPCTHQPFQNLENSSL